MDPEAGLLMNEGVVFAIGDCLQIMHSMEKRAWFYFSTIGDVAADGSEFEGFLRAIEFQEKSWIGGDTLARRARDHVESFARPVTGQIVQQAQEIYGYCRRCARAENVVYVSDWWHDS
jgi:hypothetical protein